MDGEARRTAHAATEGSASGGSCAVGEARVVAVVTGAAGMIGANFCRHVLPLGWRVHGIDDLRGGHPDALPADDPSLTLHRLDVAEQLAEVAAVVAAARGEADATGVRLVLYHFAAFAAECLSPFARTENVRQNWLATANLINAAVALRVDRFVFTSSAAALGEAEAELPAGGCGVSGGDATPRLGVGRLVDTYARPRPVDPYGVAKLACEMDLAIAARQHGLPITVLRLHNVYGPWQSLADPYRNVVGIFMRQAAAGEAMTVFGDGGQRRQFTFVGDLLAPLVRAGCVDRDVGTVHLGADRSYTVLDVAGAVAAAVRGWSPPTPTPPPSPTKRGGTRPAHRGIAEEAEAERARLARALAADGLVAFLPPRHEVRDVALNNVSGRLQLGYHAETPLREGVAAMWAWAAPRQPFPPLRVRVALELTDGCPPRWLELASSAAAGEGRGGGAARADA